MPEVDYLIALARGDGELPRLPGPRAVLRVGALAYDHQVSALCWWRLRNRADGGKALAALPDDLAGGFRRAYQHHLVRNEALMRDLEHLDGHLAARDVRAIVTKGPWLALHAYPDPGTRPIDDIDLVISEEDYPRACEAIAAAGYASAEPLEANSAAALRRAHFRRQIRFLVPGRRPLEMHFRLVNLGPLGPTEDWLWQRSRPLAAFSSLGSPAPEAMILHLLLHANQHAYSCLRLLFDLRFALEADRESLDVEALLTRIGELRAAASAFHTLSLAHELAGADLRPIDLARLEPRPLRRRWFNFAWKCDAVRRLETVAVNPELEAPKLYLLEMGRMRDKAAYVLGVVREARRARDPLPRLGRK